MPAVPEGAAPSRRARMRRLAGALLAGAGVLAVGVSAAGLWMFTSADVRATGGEFQNRLRVPPLLEPKVGPDGVKRFDLRLQAGTAEFVRGSGTATWGVNGAYLGPTLRAARGDRVELRVRNDLPEETTLHWHGMHLPASADGGPHEPIRRGATWTPRAARRVGPR